MDLHGHGAYAIILGSPVPLGCRLHTAPHEKHRCPHSRALVRHTPRWLLVLGVLPLKHIWCRWGTHHPCRRKLCRELPHGRQRWMVPGCVPS